MRILATGDNHFKEGARFEECCAVHDWMVDVAREREVDLFLDAGDIYDSVSTPTEREAVFGWLDRMTRACEVVIAKGNHDRAKDVALLFRAGGFGLRDVRAFERPGSTYGNRVSVCPWPDRSWLLTEARSGLEADGRMREALRAVMTGFAQPDDRDYPHILLGHFQVDGARVSNGQPLIGQAMNVSLSDLECARADMVIMGHIHNPQEFPGNWQWCGYTGSPYATDWGETEEKSVLFAEFRGRELVNVERIPTPATRLVSLHAHWAAEHIGLPGDVVVPAGLVGMWDEPDLKACHAAEVRLRYETPSEAREQAARCAQELRDDILARGAKSVKLEAVIQVETRARVPEIRTQATTAEQLQALWQSKGFDPGDRRQALLSKLEEL